MFYISGFERLEKPLLNLNLTRTSPELARHVRNVATLPGGEVVIDNYIENSKTLRVVKLDLQGRVTQVIYSCVNCFSSISGLLVLGDHLYIIHYNGTVLETSVSYGHVLKVSNIPHVGYVIHSESLYSIPEKIPDKQTLLLCDWRKGEVFTFKPTGEKKVCVDGLIGPRSVSYFFHNQAVYYIVCEQWQHRINVYNQTWELIRTIGTKGSKDGELQSTPLSAIVSDEDTIIIIISDDYNHRISEFSFNGTFLRHLLVSPDDINRPYYMSYYYPHLWLVHDYPHKLCRYNMYK